MTRLYVSTFFLFMLYCYPLFCSSATVDSNDSKHKKGVLGGVKSFFDSILSRKTKPTELDDALNKTVISELLKNASIAVQFQQYDSAVDLMSRVLEVQPNNTEANKIMGLSLAILNQSVSAVSFLYIAVELTDWKDLTSIYYLAESYKKQAEYDLAEKIVTKGLNNCENQVDKSGSLAFMLGSIHEAKLNFSYAADWYLMSASQQVNNTALWLRASTLEFPSQYHDLLFAQNVLAEGLKQNPTSLDIMFQLGIVLQQNKKFQEAIMLYETLLAAYQSQNSEQIAQMEINELVGAVYGNLATAFHSSGQMEQAKAYYEKAVTDTNHKNINEVLVANYAILLCSLKQWQEANGILSRFKIFFQETAVLTGIQFHGEELNKASTICSDLASPPLAVDSLDSFVDADNKVEL